MARRSDRIERAWSRLLLRANGNIGKGEALTTLYNEGIAVTDVDGILLPDRGLGRQFLWRDMHQARPVLGYLDPAELAT